MEQPSEIRPTVTLERLTEEGFLEDADPQAVAAVVEFELHNSAGEATFLKTIEPLSWLGSHQEFRGKAVELLGIIAQSEDAGIAVQAESAIRRLLSSKKLVSRSK